MVGAAAMVIVNGPAFSWLPPESIAVTLNDTDGAADADGVPLITPPELIARPLAAGKLEVHVQHVNTPLSTAVKAGEV